MSEKRIVLVVDRVRSAHNVGAFFRTADACGVAMLYLCGYTPTPDMHGESTTGKISKTALGAERWVPWKHVSHTWRAIETLKKDGFHIVALEQAQGAKDIQNFKPAFPLALVVGNEVTGLSSSLRARCDDVVEIPMKGKKESLNVSVAAGIALYVMRT